MKAAPTSSASRPRELSEHLFQVEKAASPAVHDELRALRAAVEGTAAGTGQGRLFPRAAPLTRLGIDSYLGVPFLDADGNMLGHLAVFDNRPMPLEPRRLFIFRIFAARATAERERLRAEQRLRESECRYRDLYENAPNAYLIVGADGRVKSGNRHLAEMLGYPIDELVGALIHSFMPDTPAG